jgi:hypothetical protein
MTYSLMTFAVPDTAIDPYSVKTGSRGKDGRMLNDHLVWRKAAACASGACFEVAFAGDLVHLRDQAGHRLTVSREAWGLFVSAIKSDDFAEETHHP